MPKSPLIAVLSLLPVPIFAQDKISFEEQIWPIVERSCVECHKAPYEDENGRTRKPKAGLRFDGAWAIMVGSDDGSVVVPGDGENSSMYWRTTLDLDDDEHMPPVDKAPQLSDEEKLLVKTWIDQGAEFGGWEGNLDGKPEVTESEEGTPVSEIQEIYLSLSDGLDPIDEKKWTSITENGGRVMPLAQTSPLLAVDFRLLKEEANDEKIASIGPIAKHIAQLDLSRTGVTDAGLASISELERLVRLDLNNTEVTDAGLKHLTGLENLRYLNLYATKISDAGLKQLQKIPSLRNVYTWQSNATPKGAKALQKALPKAKIVWE